MRFRNLRVLLAAFFFFHLFSLSLSAQIWPTSAMGVEALLGRGEVKKAARALCRIQQEDRIRLLPQFFQTDHQSIEEAFRCALRHQGQGTPLELQSVAYREILKFYHSLLMSEDSRKRVLALRIMEPFFVQGTLVQLQHLLSRDQVEEKVLLAKALGRSLGAKMEKNVKAIVYRLLDDTSPRVQAAALYSLRRIQNKSFRPPLLNIFRFGSSDVKGEAALHLAVLGHEEDELPLIRRVAEAPLIELTKLGQALALYGSNSGLQTFLDRFLTEVVAREKTTIQRRLPQELIRILKGFNTGEQIERRAAFVKDVPARWLAFYVREQLKGGGSNELNLAFQSALLGCTPTFQGAAILSAHKQECLREALLLGLNPEPFLPLLRSGHLDKELFFNSIIRTKSEDTLLYALEELKDDSKALSAALNLLQRSSPLPQYMLPELRGALQRLRLKTKQISQVLGILLFAPEALRQEVILRYANATPLQLQGQLLALRLIELNQVSEWEVLLARQTNEREVVLALSLLPLSQLVHTRLLFLRILNQGTRFRAQLIKLLEKSYEQLTPLEWATVSEEESTEIFRLAASAPMLERDIWRARLFTLFLVKKEKPSSEKLSRLLGPKSSTSMNEKALLGQYTGDFPDLTPWSEVVNQGVETFPRRSAATSRGGVSWPDYRALSSAMRKELEPFLNEEVLIKVLLSDENLLLRFRAGALLSHSKFLPMSPALAQAFRSCSAFDKEVALGRFCNAQLSSNKSFSSGANYLYKKKGDLPLPLYPVTILNRAGELRRARSDRQGRLHLRKDDLASFSQFRLD